jgi:hypothetical protein
MNLDGSIYLRFHFIKITKNPATTQKILPKIALYGGVMVQRPLATNNTKYI